MSNFIQINQKYALASDEYQWYVQKWKPAKEGSRDYPGRWSSDGLYHHELEDTVKSLAKKLLRTSNCTNLKGLREQAQEINEMLTHALDIKITP